MLLVKRNIISFCSGRWLGNRGWLLGLFASSVTVLLVAVSNGGRRRNLGELAFLERFHPTVSSHVLETNSSLAPVLVYVFHNRPEEILPLLKKHFQSQSFEKTSAGSEDILLFETPSGKVAQFAIETSKLSDFRCKVSVIDIQPSWLTRISAMLNKDR